MSAHISSPRLVVDARADKKHKLTLLTTPAD